MPRIGDSDPPKKPLVFRKPAAAAPPPEKPKPTPAKPVVAKQVPAKPVVKSGVSLPTVAPVKPKVVLPKATVKAPAKVVPERISDPRAERLARAADQEAMWATDLIKRPELLRKYSIDPTTVNHSTAHRADEINRFQVRKIRERVSRVVFDFSKGDWGCPEKNSGSTSSEKPKNNDQSVAGPIVKPKKSPVKLP